MRFSLCATAWLCLLAMFKAPISISAIDQGVRAGYWLSDSGLNVADIGQHISNFTHIYFAFATLSPNYILAEFSAGNIAQLNALVKAKSRSNPPIKTIMSIGGGDIAVSKLFSIMASQPASRAAFINSTVNVARQFMFDGIDVDWEFQQNQIDMNNLGLLFKELRANLETEAYTTGQVRLILTAAVSYAPVLMNDAPLAYPVQQMSQSLDWINIMAYDYYGSDWSKVTGMHTALYDPNSNLNTNYGVKAWINKGMPAKQIVLGLALYGRTWSLKNPNIHTIGSPAGPRKKDGGALTYSDVIEFNRVNKAYEVFDPVRVSWYCYSETTWISYEKNNSIALKVKYARAQGLRGYFFWYIGQDLTYELPRTASATWLS
ncbi:class V chitinase CHIT5-like [Rutidosis leptorrhynchoides]|uniref:class V chitinase CHIT5-like n=1 Tax=Rutidosis leptorrhynchoides TaxID=125765 RepID=UPI003A9978B0